MISLLIIVTFTVTLIIPTQSAQAQSVPAHVLNLPVPGTLIQPSASYNPTLLKGVNIYPNNPLRFDFIIDKGDADLDGEAFRKESKKLIKYFMAALTVPEDEMWVNLSPYEENRIIPEDFGKTEMGRDLLIQDYLLKQLSSSLIYPEDELGNAFWQRVRDKVFEMYGTTEIPVNTFNKVWIVPKRAEVYEHSKGAYVIGGYLNILMEEDYLAMESNVGSTKHGLGNINKEELTQISEVSEEVIRELIIPEIEKEVNEGKTFANLRQIYHSMILAMWYKRRLRDSVIGTTYADLNKTAGIDFEDKETNKKIYEQYVEHINIGEFFLEGTRFCSHHD